jgi:glycine/D-amino acid oxidase-like deaminating enzyme
MVSVSLGSERRASLDWCGREGAADAGHQFNSFRLTADDRLYWGGYDAIYHFASRSRPEWALRPQTFAKLERHVAETFPQLGALTFPHRWSGVIPAITRFSPSFGSAVGGRAHYALGFTGLGVAATRFAAEVSATRCWTRDPVC